MAETKVKKNKSDSAKATPDKKEETLSKYAGILKAPRVTEKANLLMQQNVYVFEVSQDAGKREVMKAVKDIHKVTPLRVNIVSGPVKGMFARGKRSFKKGTKKAYVLLKEGDKIK